jgi:hypothetical protein
MLLTRKIDNFENRDTLSLVDEICPSRRQNIDSRNLRTLFSNTKNKGCN